MSALAEITAAAAALGLARSWYPRAVERASAARLPVGAGGIIPGAEPITLDGQPNGRGVLLLHGFGDTPQSIAHLARVLAGRDYTVHAPLLAGHGRTLPEFAGSRGDEWLDSARAGWRAIAARCPHVCVVGQSLGGVLATILASEQAEIRALALLAPYFDAPALVRGFARLAPVLEPLVPYLTTNDDRSIHDPDARAASLSFGATTPALTRELLRVADRARAIFPAVRAPTIYLQSPEDNRVARGVAERACAARAGTELLWVPGSGHVLAADYERDKVASRVAEWFDSR